MIERIGAAFYDTDVTCVELADVLSLVRGRGKDAYFQGLFGQELVKFQIRTRFQDIIDADPRLTALITEWMELRYAQGCQDRGDMSDDDIVEFDCL